MQQAVTFKQSVYEGIQASAIRFSTGIYISHFNLIRGKSLVMLLDSCRLVKGVITTVSPFDKESKIKFHES